MLDYASALARAAAAAKKQRREMVVFLEPEAASWGWMDARADDCLDWQAERTYINAEGEIET
jgi:hypothetical protein